MIIEKNQSKIKICIYFVFIILFTENNLYSQNLEFSGKIIDSVKNKPVSYATVEIKNLNKKGLTGRDGKFSFDIKRIDTLIIVINAPDYSEYYEAVVIPKNTNIYGRDFILQQGKGKLKEYNLKGIDIFGNRFKEITPPSYTLNLENLSQLPIFGERDIYRSAQILPSVSRENDISSKLVIRGASHYQVLMLLDDVPVYNTFHLGGLTAIFNSDLIESGSLYSSCYPPEYGGVTSSVFNIRTRDKYSGSMDLRGSIGLMTSTLACTDKIGNGILTLAGRRTYFEYLGKALGITVPFYNYDLYGKYKYILDSNNFVTASILYTKDNYSLNSVGDDRVKLSTEMDPNWGNIVSSLRWEYYPSKSSSINLLFYNTNSFLKSKAGTEAAPSQQDQKVNADNRIIQTGAKVKYALSKENLDLLLGLEYKYLGLNYDWNINYFTADFSNNAFFDFSPYEFTYKDSRTNIAFFTQAELPIFNKYTLSLGGRFEYLSNRKKCVLNPYIRLKYIPSGLFSFYLSYGSYNQSLAVYDDNRNDQVLNDFKIPFFINDGEIPIANHFTLTAKINEIIPHLNLNFETYLIKREGVPFISNNTRDFSRYNESTTGFDIFAYYPGELFNGILSYTWGKTIRREGESSFPGNYDQRHILKAFLGRDISDNWEFSLEYFLSSGMPYSVPSHFFLGGCLDDLRYMTTTSRANKYSLSRIEFFRYRNNGRSPLYQRVDMTLTYNFSLWDLKMKSYFTLLNLLNFDNSYYFGVSSYSKDAKKQSKGVPILPLIGVYFEK